MAWRPRAPRPPLSGRWPRPDEGCGLHRPTSPGRCRGAGAAGGLAGLRARSLPSASHGASRLDKWYSPKNLSVRFQLLYCTDGMLTLLKTYLYIKNMQGKVWLLFLPSSCRVPLPPTGHGLCSSKVSSANVNILICVSCPPFSLYIISGLSCRSLLHSHV